MNKNEYKQKWNSLIPFPFPSSYQQCEQMSHIANTCMYISKIEIHKHKYGLILLSYQFLVFIRQITNTLPPISFL